MLYTHQGQKLTKCRYGRHERHEPRVYFIITSDGQYVKVGSSTRIGQRRLQMQSGIPGGLRLLGDIPNTYPTDMHVGYDATEKRIHRELEKFGTNHKSEWFKLTQRVKRYLIKMDKEQKFIPFENIR